MLPSLPNLLGPFESHWLGYLGNLGSNEEIQPKKLFFCKTTLNMHNQCCTVSYLKYMSQIMTPYPVALNGFVCAFKMICSFMDWKFFVAYKVYQLWSWSSVYSGHTVSRKFCDIWSFQCAVAYRVLLALLYIIHYFYCLFVFIHIHAHTHLCTYDVPMTRYRIYLFWNSYWSILASMVCAYRNGSYSICPSLGSPVSRMASLKLLSESRSRISINRTLQQSTLKLVL